MRLYSYHKTRQTSFTITVTTYVLRENQEDLARITTADLVAVAMHDRRMPPALPVAA
jgi:acyl-CoA hydrolase